jgi:mono/diheme cytochrome c family protein
MHSKEETMHGRWILCVPLLGCGVASRPAALPPHAVRMQLSPQAEHGRDVWFRSTFGGEKFFSLVLPSAPFQLPIGFDAMLTSNRDARFDEYGVINDPDCTAGDASTGFLDRCADPNASGVIGIRRFANPLPDGPRVLFGVTCAGCHAGLDPTRPPVDPNHPTADSIHPTVGNQFLQVGRLFAAHLGASDPRAAVFRSWAPGTVDTTAIESDHINNPGIITQFFQFVDRPYFDFTLDGQPIRVHRAGQGGEDDTGCERAALRVYFNIGMCATECMVGHLANGPGQSQTPIDLDQCRRDCPDFGQAERDVVDLCAFIQTTRTPKLADAPGGAWYSDVSALERGREVFASNCAGCHSNGQPPPHDVYSADAIHPAEEIGTNACRARTTNWQDGHIWAAFSSDTYKARKTGGPGYYRDVPLLGAWATAPFFHNNRLGPASQDPSVAGRLAAFEAAMHEMLNPGCRDLAGSVQRTTTPVVLPTPAGPVTLPVGTPVASFANLDPAHPGTNLCPELVENAGHTYGAALSDADKYALTEYVKTL